MNKKTKTIQKQFRFTLVALFTLPTQLKRTDFKLSPLVRLNTNTTPQKLSLVFETQNFLAKYTPHQKRGETFHSQLHLTAELLKILTIYTATISISYLHLSLSYLSFIVVLITFSSDLQQKNNTLTLLSLSISLFLSLSTTETKKKT